MAATNNLSDLTKCPVCFNSLIPPVKICLKGHAICQPCRRSTASCPKCRSNFALNGNKLLNQMLESIPLACKYTSSGCDSEVLGKEIKKHEKICHFRNEKCYACHATISNHKLFDHIWSTHMGVGTVPDPFSKSIKIDYEIRKDSSSYKVCHIGNDIFMIRFIENSNNKNLIFCLQYIGKREFARNFYYTIKIDQRFPLIGSTFFSCTGICMPYVYLGSGWKTDERALTLNLKQIFLGTGWPDKFEFSIIVKKLCS